MKEVVGVSFNTAYVAHSEKGLVPLIEVIIHTSEPEYQLGADGLTSHRVKLEALRFGAVSSALAKIGKMLVDEAAKSDAELQEVFADLAEQVKEGSDHAGP